MVDPHAGKWQTLYFPTAPIVSPETMYFCNKTTTSTAGTICKVEAAAMSSHRMKTPPEYSEMATGKVFAMCPVNIRANMSSFQENMKTNMDMVMKLGRTSGWYSLIAMVVEIPLKPFAALKQLVEGLGGLLFDNR